MCVYAHSFEDHSKIENGLFVDHELYGVTLPPASALDSEDIQHQIKNYIHYMKCCRLGSDVLNTHLDTRVLELLFNPRVLSIITVLVLNPCARYIFRTFFP